MSFARLQANSNLNPDFTSMMGWMSGQMANGLGFNAGETFDPPREVTSRRIQTDLSLGIGNMPFNKSQFPQLQNASLNSAGVENFFPSSVLFPNLTMHLRTALPWRSDFALRVADMTTPPSYRLSNSLTGDGQSNSIGATLRKHCFGEGDEPLLTFGANYNHVFGNFGYGTSFASTIDNYPVNENVAGRLNWNVNSFGANAILSHEFGNWIPFFGVGYNYVTGSVSAGLSAVDSNGNIAPIEGSASSGPAPNNASIIFGAQFNHSWANWFFNGELEAAGPDKGKAWIAQTGFSLPFYIGVSGVPKAGSKEGSGTPKEETPLSLEPGMILLQ
jgi:hypothetical protein